MAGGQGQGGVGVGTAADKAIEQPQSEKDGRRLRAGADGLFVGGDGLAGAVLGFVQHRLAQGNVGRDRDGVGE